MTETRKLRRGDIVVARVSRGFWPGRIWKRLDANHVVVIDVGKYVTVYRDDELIRSSYNGYHKFGHEPGNSRGLTPRWVPMTSLRYLKKRARDYNPHFGGLSAHSGPWLKSEKTEALISLRSNILKQ